MRNAPITLLMNVFFTSFTDRQRSATVILEYHLQSSNRAENSNKFKLIVCLDNKNSGLRLNFEPNRSFL